MPAYCTRLLVAGWRWCGPDIFRTLPSQWKERGESGAGGEIFTNAESGHKPRPHRPNLNIISIFHPQTWAEERGEEKNSSRRRDAEAEDVR